MIKPTLITMLRAVPAEFYAVVRAWRVSSVSEAIQHLLFVYGLLPNTPRSLMFDDKAVNRYTFHFIEMYCDETGKIDWDKVERDVKGEAQ